FFFQAEDGIRDLIVTGVQTCDLPIWNGRSSTPSNAPLLEPAVDGALREERPPDLERLPKPLGAFEGVLGLPFRSFDVATRRVQKIGRASCRERGRRRVAGGAVRKRSG